MRGLMTLALFAGLFAIGCASPEAHRARGGGPGADVGNRTTELQMHEGSDPFYKTPQIVSSKHAPLAGARQAEQLSQK